MSLVNRYKTCIGFRLWKWNRLSVELWICPPRFVIDPHVHPSMDGEFIYLFGKAIFYRSDIREGHERESVSVGVSFPQDCGKRFTIKHYHRHWFSVSNWPLVFLNIERWLPNTTITSAATDFKPI